MRSPWSDREWRRAAVYGVGVSGRAAIALLRRQGVEVIAYDERPADRLTVGELAADPGVVLHLGALPAELPDDVDGVVSSPGVPLNRPLLQAARRRGVPVIAEVELGFALLRGEVVAITGSNGKSTTTAMTGSMLRAAGRRAEVCGNIGDALSSRVEGPAGRVFVVELSSFQLEAIHTFRPDSAALLNLSPDHLDRHPDLASYRAAKAAIFAHQHPGDLAVLNADDPWVAQLATTSRRRFFSSRRPVEDGCHLDGEVVVEVTPGAPRRELFRRSDVPLPGPHNLENAMAAALLARAHGASPPHLIAGLASFRGLPHRLERVAELGGVAFYDDSKGTNLAATARSLEGFDDATVHIILGGRYKGGETDELRRLLVQKARRAYLIGEAAPVFARMLEGAVPFELAGTLDRALESAARSARPGEVVLLSPACSSFDQFDNFAARGRAYQRLVQTLAGDAPPTDRNGGGHGTQAGV